MSSILGKRKGYGSQKSQIFGLDQNYSNNLNKIFKQAVSSKKTTIGNKNAKNKKKTNASILSSIFDTPDPEEEADKKSKAKKRSVRPTQKNKADPFDFQKNGTLKAEQKRREMASQRFGLGIRRTKSSIANSKKVAERQPTGKSKTTKAAKSNNVPNRKQRKLITSFLPVKKPPVKLKNPPAPLGKLDKLKKSPTARKTVPSNPKSIKAKEAQRKKLEQSKKNTALNAPTKKPLEAKTSRMKLRKQSKRKEPIKVAKRPTQSLKKHLQTKLPVKPKKIVVKSLNQKAKSSTTIASAATSSKKTSKVLIKPPSKTNASNVPVPSKLNSQSTDSSSKSKTKLLTDVQKKPTKNNASFKAKPKPSSQPKSKSKAPTKSKAKLSSDQEKKPIKNNKAKSKPSFTSKNKPKVKVLPKAASKMPCKLQIKNTDALMRLRAKRKIAVNSKAVQTTIKASPRQKGNRNKSVFDFPAMSPQAKRKLNETQIVKKDETEPRKRRRMNARERAAMKKEEDVFDFPLSPLTEVREKQATEKLKKTLNSRKRKRTIQEPSRLKRKKPNETVRDICATGVSGYQPLHLREQKLPDFLRRTSSLLNPPKKPNPKRVNSLPKSLRSRPPKLKKSSTNPPAEKPKEPPKLKKSLSNPTKKTLPNPTKKPSLPNPSKKPVPNPAAKPAPKSPPRIKKTSSAPPPSLSSVFCSQPIMRRKTGKPKISRTKSDSAIAEMRKKNLSMKSNSTLLLDFLVQRDSEHLKKAREAALGDDFQYCSPFAEDKPIVNGVKSIGRLSREDVKVVKYLLSQGANPDVMDEDGLFPLVVAIHYTRCFEVVKALVERDADVSIVFSFCGREPLSLIDIAINMNLPNVAKLFLERGALPTKHFVERFDTKFMEFAGSHDFEESAKLLFRERLWEELDSDNPDLEVIDAMCAHGLDPDECRRGEYLTPLYFVVKNQTNPDLVRILLSAGSNPNEKDGSDTPMICYPILKTGSIMFEILCLLLEYDVDLSVQVDGVPLLEFAELHSSGKRCFERIKSKYDDQHGSGRDNES